MFKMFKKCLILIITLLLCGCKDITGNFSGGEQTTAPPPNENETYTNYASFVQDEDFLLKSVFIGDSIFRDFADSGVLTTGLVYAINGVKVGEITEKRFPLPSGDGEIDLLTALANEKPENVFILLGTNNAAVYGMNGIEAFTNDYLHLITLIKTYSPQSSITALSITPVNKEREGFDNMLIDAYNNALEAAISELRDEDVRFLCMNSELKNPQGMLKSRYGQSDGIHLTTSAYHAILWLICNSV